MADSNQDRAYFTHKGKGSSSNGAGNGGDTSDGDRKHPEDYAGSTTVTTGHGQYDSSGGFTQPTVPPPPGKAAAGTTVDTASLDRFADNIATLIPPVDAAKEALGPIGLHPGNFYHAYVIQTKINGLDEDAGLKQQCLQALTDLGHALGGLRDGVRQLSAKYKSIEEANKMTAKDLHDAMDTASGKFNTFIHDAGGDPAIGPAGGPTEGGSQGSGGGTHGGAGNSGTSGKNN
ncbi:hypothetical protein [Kitasatospora sp. NPDC094015]|uniref:hypothetical protein n=1 Tax=Kitasatospora sp. NPDC094015 TaxID=3155205 RepID=UPI00332E2C2C